MMDLDSVSQFSPSRNMLDDATHTIANALYGFSFLVRNT